MSIILTSGRSAAAKLRANAGGGKPKKVPRPRTAVPANSYMPSEGTAVWNINLQGSNYSVALEKDSLEVWCNDQTIETVNDFSDTGSTVDFTLQSHKARITIKPTSKGTQYELTLDGKKVEAAKPPRVSREKSSLH